MEALLFDRATGRVLNLESSDGLFCVATIDSNLIRLVSTSFDGAISNGSLPSIVPYPGYFYIQFPYQGTESACKYIVKFVMNTDVEVLVIAGGGSGGKWGGGGRRRRWSFVPRVRVVRWRSYGHGRPGWVARSD